MCDVFQKRKPSLGCSPAFHTCASSTTAPASWGCQVRQFCDKKTNKQTNKQKGKKRTNKQTSRVANWTICPNICYCLRRTVTYQNMDLWWLFLGTSWKFWGILTLTWAMWKHLTRCSHHRNIWTIDADPSFSDFFSGEQYWLLIDPWRKVLIIDAQEKYNFAIITEHCCDVEAAEFEANLKELDFIENYEVGELRCFSFNILYFWSFVFNNHSFNTFEVFPVSSAPTQRMIGNLGISLKGRYLSQKWLKSEHTKTRMQIRWRKNIMGIVVIKSKFIHISHPSSQ